MLNPHVISKALFDTEDHAQMKNILIKELDSLIPSCPFCGGSRVYQKEKSFIQCQDCGAYHVYDFGRGRRVLEAEKAIEALGEIRETLLAALAKAKFMFSCPECGGEGECVVENEEIRVRCKLCALRGPKGVYCEEEAVYLWNDRSGRVHAA